MNTVSEAVAQLCASHTEPKARWKAMKSVKWVLVSPTGQYAGLDGLRCALFLDLSRAQVFDGRDNEQAKAQFYSAALKVTVEPQLIACGA